MTTVVESGGKTGLRDTCRLLGYTRQAYYKSKRRVEKRAFEAEIVLQEVGRLRTEQKRIGVRKLHYMMSGFAREHSVEVGRDALYDLLREHSMLVRRRKRCSPRTTFSGFWKKRYPNLAKGLEPVAGNQLWVSDITYIRVKEGFAYLSLITDAYSRKIVGYCLSEDLTAKGPSAALRICVNPWLNFFSAESLNIA